MEAKHWDFIIILPLTFNVELISHFVNTKVIVKNPDTRSQETRAKGSLLRENNTFFVLIFFRCWYWSLNIGLSWEISLWYTSSFYEYTEIKEGQYLESTAVVKIHFKILTLDHKNNLQWKYWWSIFHTQIIVWLTPVSRLGRLWSPAITVKTNKPLWPE